MNKRLKNESKKWDKHYIHLDENTIQVNIIIQEYNINLFVIIKIPQYYPFKPPNIYYKNKLIRYIYKTTFYKDLHHITGQQCLCCFSLLCSNNWCPSITIIDIIQEIHNYFIIKKRLVERFLCKKLQNYYLHQIPIHEYL